MKHTFWHHVITVLVLEAENFLWIFVSITLAVSGFVIFANTYYLFFKAAVGLPLILAGVFAFILKMNSLFIDLFDFKKIQHLCKFCHTS
ncbi:hypothetical protein A2870_01660 [Candidatus Curtissbacteria bacterium RIFCSPHIGHO2_01_FULL_41_11]|uniref:Uncharacterized protein n=1 Tax=Candidatus Curtissbacteria bacterium RIFCSPHIGHO2_01_FULL_41_11 TaxID=1797711 RepID=A0A1F5G329_9BACT|nr:MAG: hypothetical protein A2870_01660 [Candidatus Curtissbacteria bacterium RIFCSPHIGHO2_01_FULL_41_11]